MRFDAPQLQDMEPVRTWRNGSLVALRTSFPLTREQQEDFYRTVICDRNSRHRYWSIRNGAADHTCGESESILMGFAGLENIQWENRLAEISLIIDPQARGKHYGTKAVAILLEIGFDQLNLENIFGECNCCNAEGIAFWEAMIERYGGTRAILPNRKYYQGRKWNSLYFNFERSLWRKGTEEHGTDHP